MCGFYLTPLQQCFPCFIFLFFTFCAALLQTFQFPTDMLEMYFEKSWSQPDRVIVIADEQAAIVSFNDPAGLFVFFSFTFNDLPLSSIVRVYSF